MTVPVDVDLLVRLAEFLDERADVTDGPYGQPRPNTAMSLLQDVEAVLEKIV